MDRFQVRLALLQRGGAVPAADGDGARQQVAGGDAGAPVRGHGLRGRGLHSSTIQLNLSRF